MKVYFAPETAIVKTFSTNVLAGASGGLGFEFKPEPSTNNPPQEDL